jgi:arsenate reductase (glutaredoxin)
MENGDSLLYHNPRCTKSRQALSLLRERGVQPTIVDYLNQPPTAAELQRLLGMLGLRPREILRMKDAANAGLDPDIDDAELIAGIAAHPAVLERPIFVYRGRAVVGRPPEKVLELL